MAREISTVRFITSLLIPGGVLLLATWAFHKEDVIRSLAAPYAIYFCFGALTAAALLSWYYDYSRLLAVALAVGVAVWGLGRLPSGLDVPRLAAILLLPLNFILFAWMKERGIVTLSGLLKLLVVIVQVMLVGLLVTREGGRLEAILRWGERPGTWTWMGWLLQLSFIAAAALLLVLVFRRRGKVEQGIFWALIAIWIGANQVSKPDALLFYAGGVGVILVYAVLEHGYDIAYRDELTGLPGRRAFNQLLAQLGRNYAIAMCDVDHFKNFNDRYGHDAGDQVLKMVARKLSHVQGGGRPFRYGGEEFVVVFRGRSAKEALPFVESLRTEIGRSEFALRATDRPSARPQSPPNISTTPASPAPAPEPNATATITISIGVAEQSKRHSTPELVLDAADAALYRAKQAGRNCVKLDESSE